MNNEQTDDKLLKQVDALLEQGTSSDYSVMNDLASTIPQADKAFQNQLEERLVAQLRGQTSTTKEEIYTDTTTIIPKAPIRSRSYSFGMWAAVVVIAILGGYVLALYQSPHIETTPIAIRPPDRTLVIATQNIRPGETITEDMIGLMTLSGVDFAKLQKSQPNRAFFTDPSQVVGHQVLVAMETFEPFEPMIFKRAKYTCPQRTTKCLLIPDDYFEIMLPLPQHLAQEMIPGDRVDVLMDVDNQSSVLLENVLLIDEQKDLITIAAPSWKQTVLAWFLNQDNKYTLRLTQDSPPNWDNTLVEHTVQASEPLPDNFQFDLIVRLPESQGYRLVNLPYSLDETPFTANGDTMEFWFKKLHTVSITNQTTALIQMSQSDAANLDALIGLGADLIFQADADRPIPAAMPTATWASSFIDPTNPTQPAIDLSPKFLLERGKVAVSLPITDPLPVAERFDVRLSLIMTEEFMKTLSKTPAEDGLNVLRETHLNGNVLEYWLTDIKVVTVVSATSIGIESTDDLVTLQVTPDEARALTYLIDSGAEVQFFPASVISPIPSAP